MSDLSRLLNEIKTPPFEELLQDIEALTGAACHLFRAHSAVWLSTQIVQRAERCVFEVQFLIEDDTVKMYVKNETGPHDARKSATQISLDNLLTDRNFAFATAQLAKGNCGSILFMEEVKGLNLNNLDIDERSRLSQTEEYSYASGGLGERMLILGLSDRGPRNVRLQGRRMNDFDYGFEYGYHNPDLQKIYYGPYGEDTRFFGPIPEAIQEGRRDMIEIMRSNVISRAETIDFIFHVYDGYVETPPGKLNPRQLMLHYAEHFAEEELKSLLLHYFSG